MKEWNAPSGAGNDIRERSDPQVTAVIYPDEESKKATEKAMALLLHKDRTEHELIDKLRGAKFSDEAVSFALEYVSSYGYIDDLRYAKGYTDYHRTSKSRREIRRKLKEKGISDDILSEIFSDYMTEDGQDPEEIAIRALVEKRLRGKDVSDLTYEEKQKQMRYLAGKGYPTDLIKRVFS